MQVQVRVKGLPQASRLRTLAAEKLKVALSGFAPAVQEVTVHMHDINGPQRGGVDKLCRVVLRLKDSSFVVIEDLGVHMTEVVDRVTDRVQRMLDRQSSRLAGMAGTGRRHYGATAGTA